jgi:hypothetical protein
MSDIRRMSIVMQKAALAMPDKTKTTDPTSRQSGRPTKTQQ